MSDTDASGWSAPDGVPATKKSKHDTDASGWSTPDPDKAPQGARSQGLEAMRDPKVLQQNAERTFGFAAPGAGQREIPEIIQRALGRAPEALGAGADMLNAMRQRALSRPSAAERVAAQPSAQSQLKAWGKDAFEAAKSAGGELPDNWFQGKVAGDGTPENPGIRDRLASSDINLADHPELYKQANDMMRVIDKKVEGGSIKSFADLMKLERELRPYVRRANAEAARENDRSGLAAATMVRRQVSDMLKDFPEANAKLTEAKNLWRRQAKMDDIQEIVSTARQLKKPEYLQSEFEKLLKDKYEMNNYTPAEQKLITRIAQGGGAAQDIAETVAGHSRAGAAGRLVGRLGGNRRREKLAEELIDLIGRGGQESMQSRTVFNQLQNRSFTPP